jgi:hypothetical protein
MDRTRTHVIRRIRHGDFAIELIANSASYLTALSIHAVRELLTTIRNMLLAIILT